MRWPGGTDPVLQEFPGFIRVLAAFPDAGAQRPAVDPVFIARDARFGHDAEIHTRFQSRDHAAGVERSHAQAAGNEEIYRTGAFGAQHYEISRCRRRAAIDQIPEPGIGGDGFGTIDVTFNGRAVVAVGVGGAHVAPEGAEGTTGPVAAPAALFRVSQGGGDFEVVLRRPILGRIIDAFVIKDVLVVHDEICANIVGQGNDHVIPDRPIVEVFGVEDVAADIGIVVQVVSDIERLR